MESREFISVVVPLYNKSEFIQNCLGSILQQESDPFEIVVIDDGSTDDSAAQAEAIRSPRIRVIRQANQGRSSARNRGIEEARGSLIAFLDADDLWLPGFLDVIRELRADYPHAGLYATGVGRCWQDGGADAHISIKPGGGKRSGLVSDYLTVLHKGDFITSSNVAIPKSVLERLGGFIPGVALGEDRELWARIALHYPFACDSRVRAFYFTPSDISQRNPQKLDGWIPPAVESLCGELQAGLLTPAVRRQARIYIDWTLVRHAEGLLVDRHFGVLRWLSRSAPFQSASSRRIVSALAVLSRIVPESLVNPLLVRIARIARKVAGLAPSGGTALSVRRLPCSHGAKSECRPASTLCGC
jgi:hypothetical protein